MRKALLTLGDISVETHRKEKQTFVLFWGWESSAVQKKTQRRLCLTCERNNPGAVFSAVGWTQMVSVIGERSTPVKGQKDRKSWEGFEQRNDIKCLGNPGMIWWTRDELTKEIKKKIGEIFHPASKWFLLHNQKLTPYLPSPLLDSVRLSVCMHACMS